MTNDKQQPGFRRAGAQSSEPLEVADYFRRMRAEDRREAPALTAVDETAARAQVWTQRLRGAVVSGAAAACLLVVAGLVVTEGRHSADPAALYASTMSDFVMETDQFLVVSDSVSPGMAGLPDILDPAQAVRESELVN